MHSHVLPGIDDGAPDVATAVQLVTALRDMGYERLIATPHVLGELHPNTPTSIRGALQRLRTALTEAGVAMKITAAAEYMLDDHFDDLLGQDTELLTLDGERLLVELPQAGEPPNWRATVFTLQTRGFRVVLAHPERYRYLANRISLLADLAAGGVELQPNLLSFTGYYGKGAKRMAEALLDQQLVHFLGTDLHHDRHVLQLRTALRRRSLPAALLSVRQNQQKLLQS